MNPPRFSSTAPGGVAKPPADPPGFPSLAFTGRKVVSVRECAESLRVTEQHIINLIETGDLNAINVAGASASVRVPRKFLEQLGERLGRREEEMLAWVASARAESVRIRQIWRIPVEAVAEFIRRRHSGAPILPRRP